MRSEPLAVAALQVPDTVAARLAGVSRATWWRLHAAAKTPAAIRLGRKVLWNRAELEAWIHAKCPDRRTWEADAISDPATALCYLTPAAR